MPNSSADGVQFTPSFSLSCRLCGLLATVPESQVVPVGREHWAKIHPKAALPVRGRDYFWSPSPVRCDTCSNNVEPPYWKHISSPPTSSTFVVDADGIWITCDTCHRFWLEGDIDGWVAYTWSTAGNLTPGLAHERNPQLLALVQADARTRFTLLLQRWDAGVITNVGDVV